MSETEDNTDKKEAVEDSQPSDYEEKNEEKDEADSGKSRKEDKLPLKKRIKRFFANPKKRLIFIISAVAVIILALIGLGLYFLRHENKNETPSNNDSATEEVAPPVLYPAVLDGIMTDQASATRHPLGIMVENHPDARPQSGLDKASIVYEAIAEGGITRFLALYGTYEAEKVGPVRSARTYYVDWAEGYSAYLAHVGGNIDALDKIAAEHVLDLDQFRYSSPYWREKNGNVSSEHTMFTSTTKLRGQATSNKYETANNFSVYKFKDDPAEIDRPESQKVSVNFSTSTYNVVFQYDKATNSYKRFMAGTAHNDRVTGNQLNPKNIVAMTVARKATVTRINEAGYTMTTVGSGAAKFYIDGKETVGTWKKESKDAREIFYDATGAEIVFDRGQLWISVIPPDGSVTAE